MYQAIKSRHQKKYDKILSDCDVFWAFNKSQLKEGIKKSKITKDNKMVPIGMGGYMPSKNFDKFIKETDKAEKERKQELKALKEDRASAIMYELNNHECSYTGDITPVIELFKGIYTPNQINKVFQSA